MCAFMNPTQAGFHEASRATRALFMGLAHRKELTASITCWRTSCDSFASMHAVCEEALDSGSKFPRRCLSDASAEHLVSRTERRTGAKHVLSLASDVQVAQ